MGVLYSGDFDQQESITLSGDMGGVRPETLRDRDVLAARLRAYTPRVAADHLALVYKNRKQQSWSLHRIYYGLFINFSIKSNVINVPTHAATPAPDKPMTGAST